MNQAPDIRKDQQQTMPVLFVGHGNPMYAIEENEFSQSWKTLGETLPRPKAILCISAHWETNGTFVTAMSHPSTIHDFGGFPKELFAVDYPATGSPELAYETKEIVTKSTIELDQIWGLDHGAWSVIRNMYPKADVPVVQLSINYNKSPKDHYELAQQLQSLRRKGILIIGSGNLVHNLRLVDWTKKDSTESGYDWALQANDIFKTLILQNNHQALINYTSLGREVQMAVPSPDHFLPLLYSLALQQANEAISFFNDKAVMGSLTMTSLKIG